MFMRVTTYSMKPGSLDQAKAMLETMKNQIMAMPGMIRFTNSVNDDGSGCVVAVIESREISEANAPAVAEAWAQFADFLTSPPEAHGYEVFADWSN